MENINFKAIATKEGCINVIIDETVNINDLKLTIINDIRTPILTIDITSRDIYICCHLEKPTFAKINETVKYVEGSGSDSYKDIFNDDNK